MHQQNYGQSLAQNFLNSGQSIRGNWLSYTSFARNDLSAQSFFLITGRGKKKHKDVISFQTLFFQVSEVGKVVSDDDSDGNKYDNNDDEHLEIELLVNRYQGVASTLG